MFVKIVRRKALDVPLKIVAGTLLVFDQSTGNMKIVLPDAKGRPTINTIFLDEQSRPSKQVGRSGGKFERGQILRLISTISGLAVRKIGPPRANTETWELYEEGK
ncbi:MAG: hypothetical protein WC813_04840 [Patescibacteria group bacterium]|jgi:hypothetical protein